MIITILGIVIAGGSAVGLLVADAKWGIRDVRDFARGKTRKVTPNDSPALTGGVTSNSVYQSGVFGDINPTEGVITDGSGDLGIEEDLEIKPVNLSVTVDPNISDEEFEEEVTQLLIDQGLLEDEDGVEDSELETSNTGNAIEGVEMSDSDLYEDATQMLVEENTGDMSDSFDSDSYEEYEEDDLTQIEAFAPEDEEDVVEVDVTNKTGSNVEEDETQLLPEGEDLGVEETQILVEENQNEVSESEETTLLDDTTNENEENDEEVTTLLDDTASGSSELGVHDETTETSESSAETPNSEVAEKESDLDNSSLSTNENNVEITEEKTELLVEPTKDSSVAETSEFKMFPLTDLLKGVVVEGSDDEDVDVEVYEKTQILEEPAENAGVSEVESEENGLEAENLEDVIGTPPVDEVAEEEDVTQILVSEVITEPAVATGVLEIDTSGNDLVVESDKTEILVEETTEVLEDDATEVLEDEVVEEDVTQFMVTPDEPASDDVVSYENDLDEIEEDEETADMSSGEDFPLPRALAPATNITVLFSNIEL